MSISITSLLSSFWFAAARGGRAKRCAAAIQSILVLLLSVTLGACGGGSGGSSDNAPTAQPFNFAQAGPIALYRGETFTNTASGPGADGVSYVSTNTDIAVVDGATGTVTVVNDGSVVIVANKLVNVPNSTAQLVAGQASYTINSSAAPLAFEQAGPISLNAGENITNTASGPGPGVTHYESSDTRIAVVDGDTGVVTATGPGNVTITASKLVSVWFTDQKLIGSSATYTINVSAAALAFEHPGPISLYVRDHFTNTVSGPGQGVAHYESSDVTVATVDSDTGAVTVTGPGPVVITAKKLFTDSTTNTTITTSTATYTINATASGPAFSARYSHTVTAFNGQLWLIGGAGPGNELKNDVWSSPDGITWTLQTANAAFSPRGLHQVVVFNNQLWLIGGYGGVGGDQALRNDVWSSSDGITWTEQTAAANFLPRGGHQVVVYNNQMLLTGGYTSTDETNDVWSSPDGINWTKLTTTFPVFSTRHAHQMLVYNNKVWVIGGYDSGFTDTPLSDVWSSSDGVTWTQETAGADFPSRGNHQVVAYNNELWLIGGFDGGGDGTNYNDVWSSSDGITWTEKTAAAAFWARNSHQVVVNNNQLLLLGGIATSPDNLVKYMLQSDAWTSSDGINWQVLYRGAFQSP
ncbi:MAG TPA: hypothetical protein VLC91_02640 [Spongiibacteraceae bacterium]|nr:hypothetical protein [Spongiibacteraceae bacterium]